MHTGLFALESALIASVVVLSAAIIAAWISLLRHMRFSLWFTASGVLGAIYFGLFAISAGPAPKIARGDISLDLRLFLVVASVCLAIGVFYLAKHMSKHGRIKPPTTLGVAAILAALMLLSSCRVSGDVRIEMEPPATRTPMVAAFITPTPAAPVSPLAAPESPLSVPMELTPDVRPYTDQALPMPGTTSGVIGNTPGD